MRTNAAPAFAQRRAADSAVRGGPLDCVAMPAPTTHLLYLHGFRSSPRSAKAQRMQAWVAEQRPDLVFACPQLPPSPAEALALAQALVANWPRETMALMGSSLGGFYATALAEGLGCPAVLLNPAVDPARDLARHLGEQHCWQDPSQQFYFRAEYVDELRALAPGALTRPERYLAVIAKGDEVLDWREMHARYAAARIKLLEGSDHGLSDFDDYLHELTDFLQL
jgi:uncharacterized protein